jgi:hypothetical protein
MYMLRSAAAVALLALAACDSPSTSVAPRDDIGPDLAGPVYTSSQTYGIDRLAESYVARKRAGRPDRSVGLVFQPGYTDEVAAHTSTATDPGGIVLLYVWWPVGEPEPDWSTLDAAAFLDKARVRVGSGNGISALNSYCGVGDPNRPFCRHATLAAAEYLSDSKKHGRYVIARQGGVDQQIPAADLREKYGR